MSHQYCGHHHSEEGSGAEVDSVGLPRYCGFVKSLPPDELAKVLNLVCSSDAHDLVRRCSMSLETLAAHEHTFLLSFERDGDVRSLDKAITICEFASSRYLDGHPWKFDHLCRLGMALKEKGLDDEAISAYERALDAAVDLNVLTNICFNNIGALLKNRYNRLGDAKDLQKAIWAQEMCIVCTAEDANDLDSFYGSLSASLTARWELLKDEEDLDRMLTCAEKAVELNPSNAHNQSNLGVALQISYYHHHALALVDRAILAMQSAVSYSMPCDRMKMLTVFASTYHLRLLHVGDPSDASACIKYLDQAMECGKINLSSHFMLIECLQTVFSWHNDVQCYERACLTCDTLLADDSLSNIERCRVLTALGAIVLSPCLKRALSPDPRQLEKCIQTLERAIKCMPPGQSKHNGWNPFYLLSDALRLQIQLKSPIDSDTVTATVSEFEYAISIGRKAVELATKDESKADDDRQANCLMTLGQILTAYGQAFPSRENQEQCVTVFRQASQLSSPTHDIRFASAVCWAEHSFAMRDWWGCFDAYTIATESVHRLTWLGLSVAQQHRVISRSNLSIHQVGRKAARAAVHLGFNEIALEWIEQCRSIVWRRILNLRVSMDAIAIVAPTLARRLGEVSEMLQSGAYFDLLGVEEANLEMRKQQQYRLAEEWEDLVAQTRKLPGFTDFLKPKGEAYFTSCEFGGMVVLLNVYTTGCDAIVLSSNMAKVVNVELSQMNEKLATTLQTRLREILHQSGRPSRDARASRIWSGHAGHDVMSNVLSVLWTTVVKPLFDFLHLEPHDSSSESDPPRLWWCPTGSLSFLPLHAAGLYNTAEHGTKVYEYVASSYTPTVGILADISNQPSEEFSGLLTVCQPNTPGQNPIPKTEDEVCSVVQVAVESGLAMDITPLDKDDATPDAVLTGMAEHSWIHLACHARQDTTQPLESAFMLAGDPQEGRPLKLTEIAERANANADFAFLSACQTATGDVSLSEEAVHLAAGMLMAGYRRVIATMWAVNDSDAPIIAEMVYKHMLSDGKADSGKSGLALHYATASMRQKAGEKNFMSWVPFIHYGA
ncbi:uncharacterized protein ARMOST_03105 [Armillaria ostoyae]|uniref:CHAT domain-containing protein n=1 Tax=Armillaria ostoyae TaxID=47428 RepID=A0A284QTI2_ARMOS|nr:uncharacterized protein ARMOST_03105 [Armillaria ostoyae]